MKILTTTGGSKHSDEAVCSGAEIARLTNSPLTILTVIKDPGRRAEAQAIVNRAVGLAQSVFVSRDQAAPDARMETRVRLGHPAEEIINEAIEGNYDLIVVGTWPKQNLLHRLLAPTTERVVMQAPCPTLIAKGRLGSLQRVLLCISGANSPSTVTRFLNDMMRQMAADLDITVLHVMSQISAGQAVRDGWQLNAAAEKLIQEDTLEGQWLRREVELLNGTRAKVFPKVRHGLVVDEVLMEAHSSNCDLLAIGAHRQSGWQRFVLDDLTHQIVVRADRPVLVV